MSSEVCPFCGKTYKRLKSHLPHCKAAASSKTPPPRHDVTVNQTTTSSQLDAAPTKPAAKAGKSTPALSVTASPQSKKSKKASAVSSAQSQSSSPATSSQSVNTSSSSPSVSLSSASSPPSSKKKKQQLTEQIKTTTTPSSTTSSLIATHSQTASPSSTVSKPKKKSLRDLIEASKYKQISKGSTEGTRSALEDLPSGSTSLVTDPQSPGTTTPTGTQTTPNKDSIKDNTHPAFVSTETKPKGSTASKMNLLKRKKTEHPPLLTKDASSSLDSKVNESSAKNCAREELLVENKGEIEALSMNRMFLKSGNGHQAKITLQDVKATLGRAKSARQSSRPSILSQTGTTNDLRSKFRPGSSLSLVPLPTENQENIDSRLVTTKTPSDQLPSTSAQNTEPQSAKRKGLKPKQASLISLRHDGSSQPELIPTTPLRPGQLSSQVSQAESLQQPVCMNEGLQVGHHMTKLPAISTSLNHFSSHQRFLLASPPSVQTLRADDGWRMEKSQLEVKKQNTADKGSQGAVTQQSLGQVRLRQLPEWLVCRTPSRPRDVVEMVQRGWQWYYRRYIDVKKGGVGGLGMLLAGYCVLSYMWSYHHIKLDRWRKHH